MERTPLLKMHEWPTCPESERRDPYWQAALGLWESAAVSPLAGWPHEWTPGIVDAVTAMHWAIEEAKAEKIREAGKRNGLE